MVGRRGRLWWEKGDDYGWGKELRKGEGFGWERGAGYG